MNLNTHTGEVLYFRKLFVSKQLNLHSTATVSIDVQDKSVFSTFLSAF